MHYRSNQRYSELETLLGLLEAFPTALGNMWPAELCEQQSLQHSDQTKKKRKNILSLQIELK